MNITDEIITSRRNSTVVEVVKLSDKKEREKQGLFRFDGVKLFEEAIQKGISITRILMCESKAEDLLSKLDGIEALENTPVSVLSDDVFAKVSEEQAPEGIICVAKFSEKHVKKTDKTLFWSATCDKTRRMILLESVRDPGNMGTIMRSAAAFGVDTLVISRDCADIYNPKTIRGAMGALFKMNIFVFDDICDAVELLKKSGRNVYAAALDKSAARLDEVEFSPCDSVLIGNEGHGLSEKAISSCAKSLYVPMEEGSESLNAAIAASVIMWSMYKK